MRTTHLLAAFTLAAALACGGAVTPTSTDPGAGIPSSLQGSWYDTSGRMLAVQSHALGDWQADRLDGTWANNMFLFSACAG